MKKPKPTSFRPKSVQLENELTAKCKELGCSKNDFINRAIEKDLNGSNSFENCTDCDEEVHEGLRKIIDNAHGSEYTLDTSEKTGKPIKAELVWPDNDDEEFLDKEWQKRQDQKLEEPKPKVVILD